MNYRLRIIARYMFDRLGGAVILTIGFLFIGRLNAVYVENGVVREIRETRKETVEINGQAVVCTAIGRAIFVKEKEILDRLDKLEEKSK